MCVVQEIVVVTSVPQTGCSATCQVDKIDL